MAAPPKTNPTQPNPAQSSPIQNTHLRECDCSLGGLRVRRRLRGRLREPEVGGRRATQRVEVGLGRTELRAQISDDRLLRDALLSRLVQLLLRVGQTRARLQGGLRWMAVGNKEGEP
jgi:hypothetical protein